MAEVKNNFEKSLKRLEEIVNKIENETLPLEESLKLYEEGKINYRVYSFSLFWKKQ